MPDSMKAKSAEMTAKHTIPVIDRMMDILGQLERHVGGLSIRELASSLEVPRTTVYRILNTLQLHEVVRRDDDGVYHLGRRLLALAAHASARYADANLAAVCQPFLDKLAAELGEGVKLNIIDQDGAMVLAAAQGRREYALTVAAGQRMPIHASAAGKLILAHQPADIVDYWLNQPLPAYTSRTITDPARLRAEMASIKRAGWASDEGETAPSIHAIATPIFARGGILVAAISVPFVAGASPARIEEMKSAALRTARAASEVLSR
jgi:DNA-binding IclR family transcriptional regulator